MGHCGEARSHHVVPCHVGLEEEGVLGEIDGAGGVVSDDVVLGCKGVREKTRK